ncbi:hypothetical protein CGCF413_v003853 [Colletotrichum fructicola]|nr:hypothetical protein CGCF413_v003853 [Colletotrichum fructicola]
MEQQAFPFSRFAAYSLGKSGRAEQQCCARSNDAMMNPWEMTGKKSKRGEGAELSATPYKKLTFRRPCEESVSVRERKKLG